MNNAVDNKSLFEVETEYLKEVFESNKYPWEIVKDVKQLVQNLIHKNLQGFKEIQEGVFVGENVKIDRLATIIPPAIIDSNTEIRPGAYLRGNVIVGKNCVIGNSTELKDSILLNNVQVPHYNYVGNSLLGNRAHMGAGSICSNLKSDQKQVVIHGEQSFETGMRKLGAILGDHADIGCGCVLNPGTVIGKNTSVYPLTSVRGVIGENKIVKSNENVVDKI